MQGDHPATRVGEDRERQADRVDAEGSSRVQRVLLPDQQRVVDLRFPGVVEDLVAEVDGDADPAQARRAISAALAALPPEPEQKSGG